MSAVELLSQATLRAAALIIKDRGIDFKALDPDYSKLSEALKATLKANLTEVMADWKDATDARMSEGWLRELMNAQANEMGIKTLQSLGWM